MKSSRIEIASECFDKMDTDNDGVIKVILLCFIFKIFDLRQNLSAKNHPEVLDGSKSELEIIGSFFDIFESYHNLFSGLKS